MEVKGNLPAIHYAQARAAFEAGHKIHLDGRIYLVRPVPGAGGLSTPDGPTLWVTDERTLGDHGLLLHPDGRVETV